MIEAMDGRTACLLANHGMIAVAGNLKGVLTRATEVETLARQYCHTLKIGEPVLLPDAEMEVVLEEFVPYTRNLDDPDWEFEQKTRVLKSSADIATRRPSAKKRP